MSSLNVEQEKAVRTTEGPVMIVAGAGTGKTRVITHRILNLIKNGVAPHAILAITFTNKAAKEMKERVDLLIIEDKTLNIPISSNERPFVGTFHALGVHIIRENCGVFGLNRHFTIYDRADSKRAIKEAMEQCSVDPKKFDPGLILNMISKAKGNSLNYLQFKGMNYPQVGDLTAGNSSSGGLDLSGSGGNNYLNELTAQIWEKYETILTKDKALDFDDLLLKTAQLLEKHPEIRKHYNSIWKYIHIDEYQDTNRVQYKIANYLCGESRNICVVGDADQNIYSWRGATIENILNFEKDYPETKVILLEKNYRSTKTILSAANNVIEKNLLRKKKTLRTDNESGEKIALIVAYTELDEARIIADTAKSLIDSGTPPKEIAVLYRANFQSRALEELFIKKNVPYQLLGTKFFERKEIKDVLSYIRAASDQDSWGDLARIINVPTRGIGKVTVAKILSNRQDLLPPSIRPKLSGFWNLLVDIRKEIMEKKPSEAVKFVIQETGMERMFKEGSVDDEERLLNVRELVNVAAGYDHLSPREGMSAFLTNAVLATDQDELKENTDSVKLMTVHAAKGLEFEYVFIAGMEQDLFPFKHFDESEISQAEDEEERRLFYVALTRAKKKVYLSHAIVRTIYGARRVSAPSEFIGDIEEKLIEARAEEKPKGAKAIFIEF